MSGDWPLGGENLMVVEEKTEELWERVEGVRHKLTRILNPAKLTPFLRQCKVMDEQDEDEVLNSSQYPLRISKAGRLLDILRGRGQRGLQAFMESLEFYHPDQYTALTGLQPTQRCSIMLDEEGPEGLTQFLLLEVRKLREQLSSSRRCELRSSQRCRVAEEERSRAERRAQVMRQDCVQQERQRLDYEAANRELGLMKERNLELAVKYSRALEEQRRATRNENELLDEIKQLRRRLQEVELKGEDASAPSLTRLLSSKELEQPSLRPQAPPTSPPASRRRDEQALVDILKQDHREAVEQRQELCSTIARLQGELETSETQRKKLVFQCEQLQLRIRTLQLDWETEQSRSASYFKKMMELERERDQALRSRDSLQLEFTDCLLDKNGLRKRIAELQSSLEQQQREQSPSSLHCSHLSLLSEDQCFGPCCSTSLSPHAPHLQGKLLCGAQMSEDFCSCNSEEDLLVLACNTEKDINRLSTFPFPPCINSIKRRVNTEFDCISWNNEIDTITEVSDLNLSPFSSIQSQISSPDSIGPDHMTPTDPTPAPFHRNLADDITVVGGNRTGLFVQAVREGSRAESCGLVEGSELLELDQVMLGDGRVSLRSCTAEVAHYALCWWTEPEALKHTLNQEGYSRLRTELSSMSFSGSDSFYVRVNLDLCADPSGLRVCCDDILHVTDTRYAAGRCQWRCEQIDRETGAVLQTGAVPNYNRAQQLLLVRLQTMALEQNQCRKKFYKKDSERVRLIKAAVSNSRASSLYSPVLYRLSNRHGEQLVPFSLVQMVHVSIKRPVIFSPSLLSRGIIERLLLPAESSLDFNTCPPVLMETSAHQDRSVFMLDSTETPMGIRLQDIQDVMNQDKHCLLQLGLNSVETLLKQNIFPIILQIRPKDKKGRKFRKLLLGVREEQLMESWQMEELQLETLPVMFGTVEPSTWSSTDELMSVICSSIQLQQKALVWLEKERLLCN